MKSCVLIVLDDSSGAKVYCGDDIELVTCYKGVQDEIGMVTTIVKAGSDAEKLCVGAGLIEGRDYVLDGDDGKELA